MQKEGRIYRPPEMHKNTTSLMTGHAVI